ncbi:MAG TPA: phosphopantetheine-binding protein [Polyangiaceae bacterium]|nr:phosphopantetheine-binding protein [Polyangiaceae bacterium]
MDRYTIDDICEQVKIVVRESLDVQEDEVQLSSNLVRDLDGESIDFLDIVFRLERAFRIKIERGQLERTLRDQFPEQTIKPNSELSPQLRAALADLLPEVPREQVDEIRKLKEITSLFTVATFVRFTIRTLLKTRPDTLIEGEPAPGFTPVQLGLTG